MYLRNGCGYSLELFILSSEEREEVVKKKVLFESVKQKSEQKQPSKKFKIRIGEVRERILYLRNIFFAGNYFL